MLILGGKTPLEWQTYTVDLNDGSLLILLKILLLLISLSCSNGTLTRSEERHGSSIGFQGWCGRTMGCSEHPLLSHPRAQVSPPQFQVSLSQYVAHQECNKKDTRGGSDKEYKKK